MRWIIGTAERGKSRRSSVQRCAATTLLDGISTIQAAAPRVRDGRVPHLTYIE
jgi:hypothetical protein